MLLNLINRVNAPAKNLADLRFLTLATSPSNPSLGFRIAGGLPGRTHRGLRTETGGRNGPIGARLRQIQPLAHLDDLYGFATRLQAVMQTLQRPDIIRVHGCTCKLTTKA